MDVKNVCFSLNISLSDVTKHRPMRKNFEIQKTFLIGTMMKPIFSMLLVTLCLVPIACSSGNSDVPELGTVSGQVTLDGDPLANVSVSFVPASGPASYGTTDESGNYQLSYSNGKAGAVIGKHTVSIITITEGPPEPGYKDPVPAKYNENSTLTADVKSGDNPNTNFELTTK